MWVRAAALFYPRAQRSPGARRGPRPWATPRGEHVVAVFARALTTFSQVFQERHVFGLGIFAPPHGETGDASGMGNRVAAALGVAPGRRSDGRPRAFYRAQDMRAQFDARLAELYVPMQQVGETVLCRGQLARLVRSFLTPTARAHSFTFVTDPLLEG